MKYLLRPFCIGALVTAIPLVIMNVLAQNWFGVEVLIIWVLINTIGLFL